MFPGDIRSAVPTYGQSGGKNKVLVGLVERGVSCLHRSLRGAVRTVWDQHAEHDHGRPCDGRTGRLLEGDDLVHVPADPTGHGTTVARLISGREAPTGIAPDTDLLVACCQLGDMEIADGVEWIFDEAHGRPTVVSLSCSELHDDHHDGSDLLSRTIDSLTGPGRIVCVAAGNNHSSSLHVERHLSSRGSHISVPFLLQHPKSLRSDGSPTVTIVVTSQPNTRFHVRLSTGELGGTDRHEGVLFNRDQRGRAVNFGTHGVEITQQINVQSNRPSTAISFSPLPNIDATNISAWWLDVEAGTDDVTVHLWSSDGRLQFVDFSHTRSDLWVPPRGASKEIMLGRPASGRNVITAGAYVTKVSGQDVFPFSNSGPTLDQRDKPELVEESHVRLDPNETKAGTSFASATTAGLVALLLQRNDQLTPEDLRTLFIRNSFQPNVAPGWHAQWGYGKIDVERLLREDV